MWIWAVACGDPSTTIATSGPAEPSTPDGVEGADLLERIAGLWTGSARDTPLGDFPLMPVDLRAADDHAIWGRVDLDPDNALRFALEVEDHDGPQLVYRNGGYFLGLYRDDRTVLVESDPDAGTWRFCHLEQGCDYVDVTWTVTDTDLAEDVTVRGQPHLRWDARKAEARPLPAGFPDPTPLPPDAPLPALPTLETTVRWSTPTDAAADVWLILATTACTTTCVPSRFSRAVVEAGATEAVVEMPEIHPGDYLATAVVDRDRNLGATLIPGGGDGVSLPNRPITVAPSGTTTASVTVVLAP
jgi:hypothetical protein